MKYRNQKIDEQMMLVEFLLTAISEKKASKLGVTEILATDKEKLMSFDKAVQIGMMSTANQSLVATKALAISLDRICVMVNQMTKEMTDAGMDNGERYANRLEILTNFKRIMEELNPELAFKFAQM